MDSALRSFDYVAAPQQWGAHLESAEAVVMDAPASLDSDRVAELELQLEQLRIRAASEKQTASRIARDQALREAGAESERKLQAVREQISSALENFRVEREEYFRQTEEDVVKLALAIAAKVLHREANMDPLLLSGAVHVALRRLENTAGTVLRVPAQELLAWQESASLLRDGSAAAKVVADITLKPGDCVLETHVGTVELGVTAQLEEIEKGFYDLLSRRPAQHARPAAVR